MLHAYDLGLYLDIHSAHIIVRSGSTVSVCGEFVNLDASAPPADFTLYLYEGLD